MLILRPTRQLGDLQDLINRLPGREKKREEREARQARKEAWIAEEEQDLQERAAVRSRGLRNAVLAIGGLTLLGLGAVWLRRRRRR